jgi:hypothetical protein
MQTGHYGEVQHGICSRVAGKQQRSLKAKPEPPVMMKMKQENYAQKMQKMRCILTLNPFPVNKNKRLATALITTKHKRHIAMKRNAAAPYPAASSNYILSIIFL